MTSASIFPQRLTKIDALTRPDHHYLSDDDECYFLGEYTARRNYAFSATNQLIYNLKKAMDRKDRPEWRYKAQAIKTAAQAFRAALNDVARQTLTFVPVPPSKTKSDPLYDDRLIQVLNGIWPGQDTDVREIVEQSQSTEAVHGLDDRPTLNEIMSRYSINRRLLEPPPKLIAIVDDVMTTGCHFVAIKALLRREFPGTKIIGLFIARRAPEAIDFGQ